MGVETDDLEKGDSAYMRGLEVGKRFVERFPKVRSILDKWIG